MILSITGFFFIFRVRRVINPNGEKAREKKSIEKTKEKKGEKTKEKRKEEREKEKRTAQEREREESV